MIISVCMVMGMKLVRPIFEERRQAEEEIALMNFVLNSVQEPVFLIDKDARFRYVNEESCRVRDIPERISSATAWRMSTRIFLWNDWPIIGELMSARSLIFEGRHKTSDGRIFPVEINANYFEYGRRGRLSISNRRDHGGQPGCRKDPRAHLRPDDRPDLRRLAVGRDLRRRRAVSRRTPPIHGHPAQREPQTDVVMGIHRPDGALVWISINSQPLVGVGESASMRW